MSKNKVYTVDYFSLTTDYFKRKQPMRCMLFSRMPLLDKGVVTIIGKREIIVF